MTQEEYKKRMALKAKYQKQWLALDPTLSEHSGIYILTRRDENGFKYAYIGQAIHLLSRMISHSCGYQQWIDLSLKKHGLYSQSNPYGWYLTHFTYDEKLLNLKEQETIKNYADMGYQLRNITSGSQGKGKVDINERKPAKGYYDGKKQGATNLSKELQKTLKYLVVAPKDENKRTIRMYNKFWDLLTPKQKGESDDGENETN